MADGPHLAADPWGRYLAETRVLCTPGGRPALARRVWARLVEDDGPSVNYPRGDEPVALLAWVLANLTWEELGPFGLALLDLLHQELPAVPQEAPPARVEPLAAVCELVKLARKDTPPPAGEGGNPKAFFLPVDAVGRVLLLLVGDAGPTPLARRIHDIETPAGQSLLADVVRALARHTLPGTGVVPWQRLLADPALGRAALPAFLGYCRAAGNQARFGLQHVARALANRRPEPAPDLLAGTLKAFATAAYSDTDYNPEAIDLAAADFDVLFAGLPVGFVRETFAELRKLQFALHLLPVWEAAALASEAVQRPGARPEPATGDTAPGRRALDLRGPNLWRAVIDAKRPPRGMVTVGVKPDCLVLGPGRLTRALNAQYLSTS